MSDFDPIDKWFESGFRIRKQPTRNSKRSSGSYRNNVRRGGNIPPRGKVNISSGAKARNVINTVKRAPQVMVKITGNSKGMKDVKHHLDYISRNGEVELVNELGETINGSAQLKDYKAELKASQVPEESKRREFIHVMLSMPEGTDKEAFRQSLMDFAKEEFSNRQYVVAIHNDTDHVHAHINVNTRDIDRADEPRLNPKKADLQRWRQGFADKLNANGVDASASYRAARFNYRKAEKGQIRQIRAGNPRSPVFNEKRASEKDIAPHDRTPKIYDKLNGEMKEWIEGKTRPENPAHKNIEASRSRVVSAWHKVADNLDDSGEHALADEVRDFVASTDKLIISRNQEMYDELTKEQAKAATLDNGSHEL